MLTPHAKNSEPPLARPSRPPKGHGAPTTVCALPGCRNLVFEAWEETGTLCSRCAIEIDLFEREDRWNRQTLPAS